MELSAEVDAGVFSASLSPDGLAQSPGSPTPYPGFQAAETAEILASAAPAPGNRGVFAGFITEACFSYVPLNCAVTTTPDHSVTVGRGHSHYQRIIDVVPHATGIPPLGQGTCVIWRYEP
jgi:hypothetical protein